MNRRRAARTASVPSGLPKVMDSGPADRKLRIAFVYSRLPFPMMRGDQTTVAHLLSFLSGRGHSVDFYSIDADGSMTAAQQTWLTDACHQVRMYRQSTAAKLLGLVNGLLHLVPLQIGLFDNKQLTRDL